MLTREVLFDGALRTNDIGEFDDHGRLHIIGRADDVVVSGGFSVSCTRVEHIIGKHPKVHEVVVVGTPDADWGERVVAVAVTRTSAHPRRASEQTSLVCWNHTSCRDNCCASTPFRFCRRASLTGKSSSAYSDPARSRPDRHRRSRHAHCTSVVSRRAPTHASGSHLAGGRRDRSCRLHRRRRLGARCSCVLSSP